ncbi:bifunctional 4-hydroxy-2-oxoglutarate aldolase/2-dehydro-3-deoxy-phosphogluconate aldolase [Leifsonia sp. 21MFCrub1.1]|uniref:bifunctional 4-hydroxy-2-oxoglutarate aldolase/2-dehydro-3-deoxy-phosphogluconate aldolase n=1 Tax=Leifsonia sp. 21MFCrub1.1 TaxID=1798223 RepID=UPI000892A0BB|nr:bifunctional 4-hydroxy-2-oxoglutarate aldolase/2-dehydro-3-deoxy-phosphogluconate aldolase [Leifsonia sp. 21MFCrub1.1]SEB09876.1 2-dehydro-3-deoxyphosphogluconate aldolase / (4S)-4-hydroxy-2-oxoglutarate aldolase [Leifsonia sp. 21MFCrub1.1]
MSTPAASGPAIGSSGKAAAPGRLQPSAVLRSCPVIAVLRARDARDYDPVIDVLAENGILSVEVTLTTPGTVEQLPSLLARTGTEIGVGTITSVDDARRAIDSGARYLVTPVTRLDIVACAVDSGVPVFPGGLTPTELFAGWEAGATAVKVFPAATVGAQYGSHLRGPFPDIEFVPSGGVALDDISAWLDAGAAAVSLGGPLLGDALMGGSLDALARRTRRVVEIVAEARSAR